MADFDTLIRGGTVIDGSRAPRFDADIGLADGRIAAIGDLAGAHAAETVDATGRIVAPGFIDSHTHDDLALLAPGDMGFKVSQGVTTVIAGNCGISLAPLKPDSPLPSPLDLMKSRDAPRFGSLAEYFASLQRQPAALNCAALVGHTTLRACAMPDLERAATAAEIEAMRALLAQALDDGAIGMSTGTFYPPARHASTEEIIAVGEPLRGRGAVYATHMRNEGDEVMVALDETFAIGRALQVPVIVSHHKVQREANFGRSRQTLPHLRQAMGCQCVGLDAYPYTAGSTMIHTDPQMLEGRVLIASSGPHPECVGRDLAAIAAEWGVPRDEAARRLRPGTAIYFMMDEGDVRNILAFDETMIGSDGIPVGERPHPRLWGTFPKVLGHYSRDIGLFALETAVWKMTGLTARNYGLADRGRLAVGCAADVVVFDAATVADRATYENPTQPAAGIEAVWVNGRLTWQGGGHTGARAGQVLRRDEAAARSMWKDWQPAAPLAGTPTGA